MCRLCIKRAPSTSSPRETFANAGQSEGRGANLSETESRETRAGDQHGGLEELGEHLLRGGQPHRVGGEVHGAGEARGPRGPPAVPHRVGRPDLMGHNGCVSYCSVGILSSEHDNNGNPSFVLM